MPLDLEKSSDAILRGSILRVSSRESGGAGVHKEIGSLFRRMEADPELAREIRFLLRLVRAQLPDVLDLDK